MFVTPAVAGDRLFVGSCAGSFYAFDAASGAVAWRHDTAPDGRGAQFHGDVLLTDELVVVGADARPQAYLYALEHATGRVRWKLAFPGGVSAQVLGHGGSALAVAANGEVLAVDLATGVPGWLHDEPPAGAAGTRTHDPALADGRLFVAWWPGIVDAYDAASGELLWRRDLGGTLGTSVAVFAGEVVVGDFSGRLHRLAPSTGELLGTLETGGAFYGDLVVDDGCLLALSAAGADPSLRLVGPYVVSCFAPGLAKERWRHEGAEEWSTPRPLVQDGQLVIGAEGQLVGLSLADGSPRWTLAVDGVPRGLGASGEHLFVGTLEGDLFAYPWGAAGQ